LGKNAERQEPKEKKIDPPSSFGGIAPTASKIPGESIDEHRKIETANIMLTGDEIRQQNENL
jgi:hypothetical protein